MPFVDRIVKHINDTLKASSLTDKRFQPGRFLGCTTLLARQKGTQMEVLPATVDKDGEYKLIDTDDRYPITIYHKVLSNGYASAAKQSYGDEYAYKCTTEMTMVVLADSRKIRMQAEQLEPLIIYGIPQRLSQQLMTDTAIRSCLITVSGSVLDKINVFKSEYPSTDYFLKPFHQLFSIRYRIEAGFDKNCIQRCLCE